MLKRKPRVSPTPGARKPLPTTTVTYRVVPSPETYNQMQLLREHVRGCARFLDEVKPGWENQLDPGRLNFSSNSRCVVGQLWGHVRSCTHWDRIIDQYPLAVMSSAAIPLWGAEVKARGGVFRPQQFTFPVEWTGQHVLNGQHRLAALAGVD